MFRQIVSEKVVEIQATTIEVENILHIKHSGRNESATIFTTFGDEDTRGDPSIEGKQSQAYMDVFQQIVPQESDAKMFNL